ncbi:BnaC01g23310D [Brassica napus]|uniref:Non-specific lipid-transfer protein n=1 Tax=Brassica napus TaxID=3708 RepID=A0A078FT62_BRANA|nr:BnaC01g23310D [Brassica napus]
MAFASKIITCLLILTIYIAAPTDYLTNGGPLPSSCCVAVKSLNQMAQTTPDRRQVCECLKSAGKEIKGLNIDLVAALPTTCGVSLSYPIGFNTNCDR